MMILDLNQEYGHKPSSKLQNLFMNTLLNTQKCPIPLMVLDLVMIKNFDRHTDNVSSYLKSSRRINCTEYTRNTETMALKPIY